MATPKIPEETTCAESVKPIEWFYLTRDADEDGELDDFVDIWSKPPTRNAIPGFGKFTCYTTGVWDLETYVERISKAKALKLFNVIPDHYNQVIKAPKRELNPQSRVRKRADSK